MKREDLHLAEELIDQYPRSKLARHKDLLRKYLKVRGGRDGKLSDGRRLLRQHRERSEIALFALYDVPESLVAEYQWRQLALALACAQHPRCVTILKPGRGSTPSKKRRALRDSLFAEFHAHLAEHPRLRRTSAAAHFLEDNRSEGRAAGFRDPKSFAQAFGRWAARNRPVAAREYMAESRERNEAEWAAIKKKAL